jgi:pilus assembly protein Flp/PilA
LADSSPVVEAGGSAAVGETGMKNLALKLRRFMVSEDGPTAVEYAVMLALIVIVCLSAITTLGTNAKTTFTNIGSSLGS